MAVLMAASTVKQGTILKLMERLSIPQVGKGTRFAIFLAPKDILNLKPPRCVPSV